MPSDSTGGPRPPLNSGGLGGALGNLNKDRSDMVGHGWPRPQPEAEDANGNF